MQWRQDRSVDRQHSALSEIGVRICAYGFYPLLGAMLWARDEYSNTILGTVLSVVLQIAGAMFTISILAVVFSPVLILLAIIWEAFFKPNHQADCP